MAEKKPDPNKLAQTRQGVTSRRGTPLSSGRLQSIRTPRDLTLRGSSKRTYTPTIPVRRFKEEPKDTPPEQTPKRGGGQTRSRGRGDRGRGRGRGWRPDIIQSKSIFSEGLLPKMGSSQARAPSYGEGGGGGGSEGESSKSVKVKVEKKFDPVAADRILKIVESDGEMDMDEDQLKGGMLPIHIPLAYHDRFIKEVKEGKDITTAKVDSMDTNEEKPLTASEGASAASKGASAASKGASAETQSQEQITCASLFTDEAMKKEQMLFFQFPDTLPTNVSEGDESDSKSKGKPLRLQDMSEGYIGKLRVHKSGKVKLVLGDVSLDVSMGTPCNFLQDVVSIHTEEGEKSMMTLGHVKHRLVCTPDFEELLKDKGDKKDNDDKK